MGLDVESTIDFPLEQTEWNLFTGNVFLFHYNLLQCRTMVKGRSIRNEIEAGIRMQPINHVELEAVISELKQLAGSMLQGVRQPEANVLILEFHHPEHGSKKLLVNADDDRSRLHLVERHPRSPATPYGFCQLLRNRLLPSRLVDIEQVPNDRVVILTVQVRQEDGLQTFRLVAELTARHANLLLLDERDTIHGLLRGNRSRKRRLTPGQTYEPVQPFVPSKTIVARFAPGDTTSPFAWNETADVWFGMAERHVRQEREWNRLKRLWKTSVKKLERSRLALEKDRNKALKDANRRRDADLMQIHFQRLVKGQKQIEVDDIIENSGKVTIALDTSLTPRENIEKLYRKAKKAERAGPLLDHRQKELDDLEDRLSGIGELFDLTPDREILQRLRSLLEPSQPATKVKKTSSGKALPFKRFLSASGQEIWVGRNAKENDRLTVQSSKGDDFWYHARGWAGSHVLVPMRRNKDLDPQTHLDAATLAAHYSKARGESAEVMYTRARYVRKTKGAPAGEVFVSKSKTIYIIPEKERLKRLKRSRIDENH